MINLFKSKKSEREKVPVYKIFRSVKLIGLEGLIWISSLLYLAFFNNPFNQHFTICPLSNAGFEHCPGCGLGNAVSLLLNGYFIESFYSHILGIPAVVIILFRVYSIIKFNLSRNKSLTKSRSIYA
ncbi:MAG: DUF2752 domain-containing protein [Ignavibacteriaceae bacterium]